MYGLAAFQDANPIHKGNFLNVQKTHCLFRLFGSRFLIRPGSPSGGQPLFSVPVIEALKITNKDKGSAELVPVEGQAFQQALKCTTFETTTNVWDVQVETPVPVPVKTGDVILAEFWMKADKTSVESGEASSEFILEHMGEPWTKAISYSLSAGSQWKKYSIPFTMAETWDTGNSHICFRMGYHPQVLNWPTSK